METSEPPRFLTVDDLAAEFRTSPETIYWWLKVGKAPKSMKFGRRRLFARVDVEAFIAEARGEQVPA